MAKMNGQRLCTQYQYACAGRITPQMVRMAQREGQTAEFIRAEVARGRLVIPANIRHLAGAGGKVIGFNPLELDPAEQIENRKSKIESRSAGHPGARGDAANLWVNQTVTQRLAFINDPEHCRGVAAAKRLDPMGIGRMVTTKINANIGASPVSSGTAEEVEKLNWAQKYRGRHADGFVDRRESGGVPAGDHRSFDDPDRDGADLFDDHRAEDRGSDAGHDFARRSSGRRSREWIISRFTRGC